MIYDLEHYDKAFEYVSTHEGYTIKDLGNGTYEVVKIVVPTPTVEEQNEAIRLKREQAYQETSDHLKQDYDEALARGEADADAKRVLWLESKDKVRADNPYIIEEETQPEAVFSDNSSTVDNQVIDK